MKIGVVLTIFDENWQETFKPLFSYDFDFFELLPENSAVYTLGDLNKYFKEREVILHAPFIQANLISNNAIFREASKEYLTKELLPLIEVFHPKVITTHAGSYPFIYPEINLSECKKLLEKIPQCVIENMPGGNNMWRKSYPSTEQDCDFVIKKLNGKMTFDVGHFMKQGLDVYKLLEKYLPNIVDIHIHDLLNGEDHQTLGTGELDIEKFMKILVKEKYKNYLSIELHHDNVAGMIKSYKLLRSC